MLKLVLVSTNSVCFVRGSTSPNSEMYRVGRKEKRIVSERRVPLNCCCLCFGSSCIVYREAPQPLQRVSRHTPSRPWQPKQCIMSRRDGPEAFATHVRGPVVHHENTAQLKFQANFGMHEASTGSRVNSKARESCSL